MSRAWILAGAVAALLVACNALNGVGDLDIGAATVTGPGGPADGGPGAPGDAAPADDGGDVVLPTCGASRVCVPAASGWTPAASPRTPTSPCPAEYATASDLLSNRTFDTCACACSPSQAVTCPSRVDIGYGSFKCDTGTATLDLAADGGCTPYTSKGGGYVVYKGSASLPGSWTCTANVTPSLQPPPPVRICSGAATSPEGCAADQVCVPAAGGNARNCVVHDGDVACPAGLTRRSLVGVDPQDGRGCSDCTCSSDNCATGQLSGSLINNCAFGTAPIPVGFCTLDNYAALSFTPSNGCKIDAPSQVTGAITFAAPKTLCCQ